MWDSLSDIEHSSVPLMMVKAAYWTIDIPLLCFMGFYKNGVLELRSSKTFKRYFRTWLPVDFGLVSLDWYLILFHLEKSAYVSIRALRVLRLLRFVRLVRLFKLHSIFRKLVESIRSEYALIMLNVSEILAMMIVACHFMACAFYALGKMDVKKTWVDYYFEEDDTVGYRYTTALHWAITQFTPASMEVTGKNTIERFYNIIVIVLGIVAFSTFVGSVTQAMTQLRKLAESKTAQFAQLRRFLGEHQVSMPLATRVWRYYEQGSHTKKNWMMFRDVTLFSEIPDILQSDLQHEVFAPILCRHPFFQNLSECSVSAMRELCHTSVKEMTYRAEQDVYSAGEVASRVHFIVDGVVEHRSSLSFSNGGSWESLESGSADEYGSGRWLAEAAMWVKWFYTGTAVSKEYSLICTLAVAAMHTVLKEHVELAQPCCTYAENFVQHLRSVGVGMSDIMEDTTALEEMALVAFKGSDALSVQVERQTSGVSTQIRSVYRRAFTLLSRRSHKSRRTYQTSEGGGSVWLHGSQLGSEMTSLADGKSRKASCDTMESIPSSKQEGGPLRGGEKGSSASLESENCHDDEISKGERVLA